MLRMFGTAGIAGLVGLGFHLLGAPIWLLSIAGFAFGVLYAASEKSY